MLFKVILSALQRTLYWGSLLQKYCNQIFNVWLIPQSARTTDLLIPFQGESESEVSQSCPTLCDPMDCSLPGSSSIGFSRQEYWSGLPFPSPGYLLDSGIQPMCPMLADGFFITEPPGKPHHWLGKSNNNIKEIITTVKRNYIYSMCS